MPTGAGLGYFQRPASWHPSEGFFSWYQYFLTMSSYEYFFWLVPTGRFWYLEIRDFSKQMLNNQVGNRFWEVVCDEHGIGGGGDGAARPRKRFLRWGLGRQVRSLRVALWPRARHDRRCNPKSPLGELFRPVSQPREQKLEHGQQLGQGPLHEGWARLLLNPPVV